MRKSGREFGEAAAICIIPADMCAVLLRVFTLAVCLYCCLSPATAQQTTVCSLEVPIGVVGRNGALVRAMEPQSFEIPKGNTLTIQVATYDTGPRRIVFVIDRGPRANEPDIRIEDAVLNRILRHARPGDSFAAIVSGHDSVRVPFGQDAESVLTNLSSPQNMTKEKVGMMDAIAAAASWLSPAQPGDSIFVFSVEDEFKDAHTSFRKLYESLIQSRVRVFGMLFGPVFGGTYFTLMTDISPRMMTDFTPETEDLNHLVWGTGGYLAAENTEGILQQYRLTDSRLAELEAGGWQMYGGIAEYYRVILSTPPLQKQRPWKLNLSSQGRAKSPQATVLYPRQLPLCP